ncbi:hypothetical protein [Geoglobus acetivorans]|uniref:Uncharacterized protein n=1 Tax=Geoglobus acetivorans TaxID=565033 RepID=A0A0A7GIJ3_GEOAI|nr:hypothetical protein GACE_1705 [Geoglobus acetivorans]
MSQIEPEIHLDRYSQKGFSIADQIQYMTLRDAVYYTGIAISAISTFLLFVSYIMLVSGSAIAITGILLLAYYILAGSAGSILTALGRTPENPTRFAPPVLGLIQTVIVLFLIIKINTFSIAILLLFIPPLLLMGKRVIFR